MREFGRNERVGVQLQRELSELIRDRMKDPRIGLVTIQAVQVNRELSYAKVYVTGFGLSKEDHEETIRLLNRAAGFLRRELGHLLKLRIVPELRFVYDESVEYGEHMEDLISRAVHPDKQ